MKSVLYGVGNYRRFMRKKVIELGTGDVKGRIVIIFNDGTH